GGRLPSLESKVHLRLNDNRNDITATFVNPHQIQSSFTLATHAVPAWRVPRKGSEFLPGVDVQGGVKKSLFKRSMQPEVMHLDDFYLGGFDFSDDAAEMHLRKRPTDRDSLVFRLVRDDTELTCEVQRPGEPDGDIPMPVDAVDRAKLEQLWQLVRASVSEVLSHKERVVSVKVEDKDVFET